MARPKKMQEPVEPKRDIGQEILDGVREIKAHKAVAEPEPEPAYVTMDEPRTLVVELPIPPAVPTGYVAREIVWPAQYWRVFDKQAARGGLTVSEYLRRLLAHMARE